MTRLKLELDRSQKTEIRWFDELKACRKQVRQLEERILTPERCDRILAALGSGKQSAVYRRVKAVLDQLQSEVQSE